jgi:predicted PurR-regulated permease PerM
MKTLPLPFISRLALAIISIIGIGYLVKLGQSILAPFFLALLLALLFLPFF